VQGKREEKGAKQKGSVLKRTDNKTLQCTKTTWTFNTISQLTVTTYKSKTVW